MKSYEQITVLVDMDDVLEDCLGAWCEALKRLHGTDIEPEDITAWDLDEFFPSLTHDEIFEPVSQEEFWSNVFPKYKAVEYLQKLVEEKFNVFIVTASDYRTIKAKFNNVIKKYFSFINWDHMVIMSHKELIKGNIMIDDNPKNLEEFDGYRLLFGAAHNKNYNAFQHGMIRVYNWREIYDMIHRLVD